MPFTRGFETPAILAEKFHKHVSLRHEFPHNDEAEYLAAADTFLGAAVSANTWECYRRNGDRLRYNENTEEFGVLRNDGVIKTYFRADPQEHQKPNNLEYFRAECRR